MDIIYMFLINIKVRENFLSFMERVCLIFLSTMALNFQVGKRGAIWIRLHSQTTF